MDSEAFLLRVVVLVSLLVLPGCFYSSPEDIQAFVKPHKINVTAERYILQPPDEIEIHCAKVPEIHLQIQQIRPDGKVSFEGLGEIEAAGKTPEQLANDLEKRAAKLYTLAGDKPIDVRIVAYESSVYYVLGQVYHPGPRRVTGRDTLLTAVATARPTIMAWTDKIQVVRPSRQGGDAAKIFEYKYSDTYKRGDTSKNVLLQEGDIVYVPPTVLAAISMKIEEVLRPLGRIFSTVYIVETPDRGRGGRGYGY